MSAREFICLIEFTAQLLSEITETNRLTLPNAGHAGLSRLLTANDKLQCLNSEGLECGSTNLLDPDVEEVHRVPHAMFLMLEGVNKWFLETDWNRMRSSGVLEPDTSMTLWAYKEAPGFVMFALEKPPEAHSDSEGPQLDSNSETEDHQGPAKKRKNQGPADSHAGAEDHQEPESHTESEDI